MRFCDLIDKKKRGEALDHEELSAAMMGFLDGSVPDYQMSALLMAIFFNGMTDTEAADLTMITAKSGDMLDLSAFGNKSVDKHSTGGVGDKTTLVVAPIVASLGGIVAKMSGRGLGHTGGTVDKLEAIPGYKVTLQEDEFISIAKKEGVSVIASSGDLAPLDKKLYALRDVTSTVDSIPLIVASIMGKKLAAGSKNIVLDVKYGSGAFMKTKEDAEILAEKMVSIGKKCDKNIRAVITDMDIPLGCMVGNFSEVEEAYSILCGNKSPDIHDLREVCLVLASNMLCLCLDIPLDEARSLAQNAITSGLARDKFRSWISSQGADLDAFDELISSYKEKTTPVDIYSDKDGFIDKMDTERIGLAALALGGGRLNKDSVIDPFACIEVYKKTGDEIRQGELIARLRSSDPSLLENAKNIYISAISISNIKISKGKVIYKTLT